MCLGEVGRVAAEHLLRAIAGEPSHGACTVPCRLVVRGSSVPAAAPAESGHRPARTGGTPAESGHGPTGTGGASAESGHRPAGTGGASAESGHRPAGTGQGPGAAARGPAGGEA